MRPFWLLTVIGAVVSATNSRTRTTPTPKSSPCKAQTCESCVPSCFWDTAAKTCLQTCTRSTCVGGRTGRQCPKPTPPKSANGTANATSGAPAAAVQSSTPNIMMLRFTGVPFITDLRPIFSSSRPLTFALLFAPPQSGITLNSTGFLGGIPNAFDSSVRQPVTLLVLARQTNGTGVAAVPLLITVIDPLPPVPVVASFLRVNAPIVPLNFSAAISAGIKPPFQYVAQGFPQGTGLVFNRTHALLQGAPNVNDFAVRQPLILLLSGVNQTRNQSYSILVVLTIIPEPRQIVLSVGGSPNQGQGQGNIGGGSAYDPRAAAAVAANVEALAPPSPNVTIDSSTQEGMGVRRGADAVNLLEIVGVAFEVDFRPAFGATNSTSPPALIFTSEGLPAGSGVSVNESGFLIGTPNAADLAAPQPIIFLIKTQRLAIPVVMTVLAALPTADKLEPFVLHAGHALLPIDVPSALGLAPDRAPFTFSVSGLPQGSGFRLNATSGTLSGAPTSADTTAAQPLQVIITVTDNNQTKVTYGLLLTLAPAHNLLTPSIIVEGLAGYTLYPGVYVYSSVIGGRKRVPAWWCGAWCSNVAQCSAFAYDPFSGECALLADTQQAVAHPRFLLYVKRPPTGSLLLASLDFQGSNYSFDLTKQFQSSSPLSFSVDGLPQGSGLSVRGGALSGVLSTRDGAASQPLRLNITATDAEGHSASIFLVLTVAKRPLADDVRGLLGIVGNPLNYPLAPLFPAAMTSLSLAGLPPGAGIRVENRTLVGNLTRAAANVKQPIYAIVAGSDPRVPKITRTVSVILTVIDRA